MRTMSNNTPGLTLIATSLLAACASDPGLGEITVTVYGETFLEEGIPESEMADGWSITFERFDVELSEVDVAGVRLSDPGTLDLTEGSDGRGHVLGSVLADAGEHRDPGFTLERIHVAGVGSRDGLVKRFRWSFESPVRYEACDTTTTVEDGGQASFQITVHADHFVYDSLVHDEPALRFQALADADLDGDNEITEEELSSTDIGPYDPGSDGDVDDLWAYLVLASRTLGHVDGEGHCHADPRDR